MRTAQPCGARSWRTRSSNYRPEGCLPVYRSPGEARRFEKAWAPRRPNVPATTRQAFRPGSGRFPLAILSSWDSYQVMDSIAILSIKATPVVGWGHCEACLGSRSRRMGKSGSKANGRARPIMSVAPLARAARRAGPERNPAVNSRGMATALRSGWAM